jgi:hypothetical protein
MTRRAPTGQAMKRPVYAALFNERLFSYFTVTVTSLVVYPELFT